MLSLMIINAPIFDDAKDFSEGLAEAQLNYERRFIDKTGKMLEIVPYQK
jgi:hypothetical protein